MVALLEDNAEGTEPELPQWINGSVSDILAFARRQTPDVNPRRPTPGAVSPFRDTMAPVRGSSRLSGPAGGQHPVLQAARTEVRCN